MSETGVTQTCGTDGTWRGGFCYQEIMGYIRARSTATNYTDIISSNATTSAAEIAELIDVDESIHFHSNYTSQYSPGTSYPYTTDANPPRFTIDFKQTQYVDHVEVVNRPGQYPRAIGMKVLTSTDAACKDTVYSGIWTQTDIVVDNSGQPNHHWQSTITLDVAANARCLKFEDDDPQGSDTTGGVINLMEIKVFGF